MTGWVNLDQSSVISQHIKALCAEAKDSTYVRNVDLKSLAELPGKATCTVYKAYKNKTSSIYILRHLPNYQIKYCMYIVASFSPLLVR